MSELTSGVDRVYSLVSGHAHLCLGELLKGGAVPKVEQAVRVGPLTLRGLQDRFAPRDRKTGNGGGLAPGHRGRTALRRGPTGHTGRPPEARTVHERPNSGWRVTLAGRE